jgi:hypothetical protein
MTDPFAAPRAAGWRCTTWHPREMVHNPQYTTCRLERGRQYIEADGVTRDEAVSKALRMWREYAREPSHE